MDNNKIDKFEEDFIESINKEEFKDIESSKDILNFEDVNEILEDLNEVKIFFENPNLKINKTIRNKLQFITHQKELIKEDENLIKDVKLFQKIYEENAEETNKEIDIIKNNFIELSKSIEKIINLIEKVKFEFYSSVKQMMNPIIIEIENINKINKNKLNKKVLKIFEEKKKKLSKNIEEYDKKLSIIIKEIKNVFSKVKSNIEIYIDSLNNLDTPINLMNENIEKILENFE